MNIEHISVSRRDTFLQCPQKYKYRYHLNVESPTAAPFYFVYGKIIHKIAEVYVQNNAETDIFNIKEEVLNGSIPLEKDKNEPIKLPIEYKNKINSHINSIKHMTDRVGTRGETEVYFNWDLSPPNNYKITGVIDRIIEKNGVFYIIDYKTTKPGIWQKTSASILQDIQLKCYSRAIQKIYDVPASNIKAALFYLEGSKLVGAQYSQRDLLNCEQEMLQIYKQIKFSDPDKVVGKPGSHCNRCDYKLICPFFTLI